MDSTYMRVEEKRVHSPRERFDTPVKIIVVGGWRQVAAMLGLNVFFVSSMLGLGTVNPERAHDGCMKLVNQRAVGTIVRQNALAGNAT